MDKNALSAEFALFAYGQRPGLGQWLSPQMHDLVFDRLTRLNDVPISKVQFNQLLVVSKAASVSDGFFRYYWRTRPVHPYDVATVPGFSERWTSGGDQTIVSRAHLQWGLYRLYIDGLLFFGNVSAAFEALRSMDFDQLGTFYRYKRFDTDAITARGPSLPLHAIDRDNRYLISEMACKTFGDLPIEHEEARKALQGAWESHQKAGGGTVSLKQLLMKHLVSPTNQDQLMLSYDDINESDIDSDATLQKRFDHVVKAFVDARGKAIKNTDCYLSMVNDLDVYVATSMRTRKNFRDMADACDHIFSDERLKRLHLRYFDPTLSAARGHEDKGLIECLMVKCAKVLVYCEGEKESYGKDAEAAMALSLGKPVIFYCDHGKKTGFYRDVHPLARLIDFRTGVAVGAIVSDDVRQVSELLSRIFENRMEYRLEHHPSRTGFLKLVEQLTKSVVRLQTDDELITTTFWNTYHNRGKRNVPSLASGKEIERIGEVG